MEIKGFKYVEIKGAMKQTHRRQAFVSGKTNKLSDVVEFVYTSDCDHLDWHVENETDIEEEKDFMMEGEKVGNDYVIQTTLSFKGEHKLTAICYDKDNNEIERSETFIISVK